MLKVPANDSKIQNILQIQQKKKKYRRDLRRLKLWAGN